MLTGIYKVYKYPEDDFWTVYDDESGEMKKEFPKQSDAEYYASQHNKLFHSSGSSINPQPGYNNNQSNSQSFPSTLPYQTSNNVAPTTSSGINPWVVGGIVLIGAGLIFWYMKKK